MNVWTVKNPAHSVCRVWGLLSIKDIYMKGLVNTFTLRRINRRGKCTCFI